MKKAILSSFLVTALVILSTQSCKKTGFTPSCSSTSSYATDVKPLIQSYCASCHSNYSTYTGASSNSSSIRSSIVNATMPKNSSLTTDQKNKIVCWIDAGAPNN